jgi:uncharacterized protein
MRCRNRRIPEAGKARCEALTRALERMRAGHVSGQFGRSGPPASLSFVVRLEMMRAPPLLLVLVIIAGCSRTSPSLTKEQEVRQMLIENGAVDRVGATYHQYIEQGKLKFPNVPPASWRALEAEASSISEGLLQENVRLYSDNYTHDEIRKLREFYNSPVGKKFFGQLARLQQESAQRNLRWAQQFESNYLKALENAGYDTKELQKTAEPGGLSQ